MGDPLPLAALRPHCAVGHAEVLVAARHRRRARDVEGEADVRTSAMWRVGLFDLLHRRRRFVMAVIAASLAFGLSLLMAGTVAHLGNETDRIVALFHADRFVVADGGTGPFTTTRLLPASVAGVLRARRASNAPTRS